MNQSTTSLSGPNGSEFNDDSSHLLDANPEQRKQLEWRLRRERLRHFFNYLDPDYCFMSLLRKCKSKKVYQARIIHLGRPSKTERFPANKICNQKYNVITFVPLVLFEQFRYFFNFIFLMMAVSQFVPALRIGDLYTYWAPLIFVVTVSMVREALDDFRRWRRDRELNSTHYLRLTVSKSKSKSSKKSAKGAAASSVEWRSVDSCDLQVGDIIQVTKNQRVPADLVLLKTTEKQGASFIRTDQLDGETDWKLRVAVGVTQKLADADLLQLDATVYAEAPSKDVNNFIGTFTVSPVSLPESSSEAYAASNTPQSANAAAATQKSIATAYSQSGMIEQSLSIENTMWASTVVASGDILGLVVYTGTETRAVMNTTPPRNKVGLIDLEINSVAKLLFVVVVLLTTMFMFLKGYTGAWYIQWWRFFLLFSYLIPLALRVNLDLAKIVYAVFVITDKQIPETVPRTTTIPEELGRVHYLLTDKTGTLTRNEMVFKRLHIGTVSFAGNEGIEEVRAHVRQHFSSSASSDVSTPAHSSKVRRNIAARVSEALRAIALCHNVTPVVEPVPSEKGSRDGDSEAKRELVNEAHELDSISVSSNSGAKDRVVYQASSPDEVALVTWTESVGLALVHRDLTTMRLRTPQGTQNEYEILQLFPFTSETKRMGIIVRNLESNEITFYMKGADMVMSKIVKYTDWLEEECGNMAREGLRTLVVAKKPLDIDAYNDFEQRYHAAKMSIQDRSRNVQSVIESLERDLELLCLTGVEDTLQDGVRQTLEVLRNAGIKIWMLTGDKLETAISIAKSSSLVTRTQSIYTFRPVANRADVHLELNNFRKRTDCALIITGDSFQQCVKMYEHDFMQLASASPAVIVCRCSPTQKADTVRLIKTHTDCCTCAIGDGGNDVSMIQAADCGVGIVGKEGKQASLAADFSVTQFSFLARLLLVHGRNSYLRTAALGHFVTHRGVIITAMQVVFSAVFYYVSASLFPGLLLVGYATIFTMCPVFSLVLDQDVSDAVACKFPELYKETVKGREFSSKLFFMWVLISLYQGGVLMYGALLLFGGDFLNTTAIGFTALILTELLMVAITVHTWHWLMVVAELVSIASYVVAIVVFPQYFDPRFVTSVEFVWRVAVITGVSCIPLFILKYLRYKFKPPVYAKLRES